MWIRFDDLPRVRRPRSEGADFTKAWQTDSADAAFGDEAARLYAERLTRFLDWIERFSVIPAWPIGRCFHTPSG